MTARPPCWILAILAVAYVSPAPAASMRNTRVVNPFIRPAKMSPFVNASGVPNCGGACDPATMLQFQYFGGKVIPNAKIYAVFWTSGVAPSTQSDMPGFYDAVANSGYLDWLTEYSTTPFGAGGSNQVVGRGTYAGQYTITPSPAAATTCPPQAPLDATVCTNDTLIATELDAQITAGHLPPPDQHTIYMLHFAPHTFIQDPNGDPSCQGGGFCAYHFTYVRSGFGSVYYAVLPDNGPGSGCNLGCGNGTPFQNLCSSASHELGEAITDAEIGLATVFGPPLGWYDNGINSQGEIGDMCNQQHDTLTSRLGTPYTVQTLFSKTIWDATPQPTTQACVSSRFATNDYAIFFDPNAQSIAPGANASLPVHLETTNGTASSVILSISPVSVLPSTVHATLDQSNVTSVSAGSPAVANLNIAVDSGAPAAVDQVIVVNATSGALVHSASVLLQVAATASSNSPVCAGSEIDLFTPTVNGATYSWTGPANFTSTAQNPTIATATPANAGTYNVTVLMNGTPIKTGSTDVVVNPIPATPTASANTPVCALTPINLSTPSVTGATYAWTGPNGFTSSQQNPSVANPTPASFGTYSVTVTVNGCTSAAGSVAVVSNSAPSLGIYPISFVALGSGKGIVPTAPPSDDGSFSVGVSASAGFTGSLSVGQITGIVTITNAGPAGTFMITVTATDSCGLIRTSSFNLVVNAFTDDPLNSGGTPLKAQHIQELRTAIRAAAALAGQTPIFTDDPLPAGAMMRSLYVTELRDALTSAFNALHLTPPAFTDSPLVGIPVKAVHLQELRNALK